MPPGPTDAQDGLDFDDAEDATSVGTEMFTAGKVPNYPTLAHVGRYEILGRIARGGMAEVYLARAREDDGTVQHVVVKRVLSEMQHDPEMLRMFVEEGRVAVRLFHPNVCHVYEHGGTGGMTYMALEWVHGVALRDAIRRAQPKGLPVPVSVHVAAKVAGALEYVHHATGVTGQPLGIVHQDVTPHNVMLNWTGQVKLLDFGIARKVGQGTERGRSPQGKYEYMSPEQVRGRPVDPRSDVFALGCCLFEALTGTQLYGRGSPAASMTAIVEEPPPSLASVRPGLPPDLDAIVRRALAKRPEERWPSAGAMAKALERWLAQRGERVSDQRVAISIGVLFSPAEKAPLPPSAARMTGTLQAIGFEEAGDLVEGERGGTGARRKPASASEGAWAESFDHSAPSSAGALAEELGTGDLELDVTDDASETVPLGSPIAPPLGPIAPGPVPEASGVVRARGEGAAALPAPPPIAAAAPARPSRPGLPRRVLRAAAWALAFVLVTAGAVALMRPDLAERGRAALETWAATHAAAE